MSNKSTDRVVHDKRGEGHWSESIVNWEQEFNDGDVVIGDGYGSFRTMIVVHQIQLDELDYVVHRGVFWKDEYAEMFAEELVSDE